VQTIEGHIYACDAGTPTATEVPGGTLSATGPSTIDTQANPLSPLSVNAGSYTMTAGAPSGYQFVICAGTSTVNTPTSATESVTVPSGSTGIGAFYVSPYQTIEGHIYACDAGTPPRPRYPAAPCPPPAPPPSTPRPTPVSPVSQRRVLHHDRRSPIRLPVRHLRRNLHRQHPDQRNRIGHRALGQHRDRQLLRVAPTAPHHHNHRSSDHHHHGAADNHDNGAADNHEQRAADNHDNGPADNHNDAAGHDHHGSADNHHHSAGHHDHDHRSRSAHRQSDDHRSRFTPTPGW